jgi:predicted phage-related endonuclease
MKIEYRITHDVQQGTGPWLRLREQFDTASEAPAALGVGKYQTRAELLRRKHTGVADEPSAATLGKFAAGHAAESAARPLVEEMLGGEGLYPVTMSAEVDGLRLLASLDGLTLDGSTCWETKLWNEELAAAVRANDLPAHYTVQMDQELLVSGAERCLFTCTDGTPDRFVSCWYESSPAKAAALIDGWRQFRADLAAYELHPAADAEPVGKAPDTLPALRIEITGAVTASNLAEFKSTALGAIRSVNRDLQTDQDFADAERAVKWCADVESRLASAKEHALSQTADIDALFKALDDISSEARRVRLDLDKLVTRRKGELKEAEVMRARAAIDAHLQTVNAELAPARLTHAADFGGAIKGLKTIDSVRAKLDAAVAAAKIEIDGRARDARKNLDHFREMANIGTAALFPDLAQMVHKAPEDFRALVQGRVLAQQERDRKAEEARQAAEAARIAAAEQRAREDEAKRIAAEQAEAADAQRRRESAAQEAQRQAAAALEAAQRQAIATPAAASAALGQRGLMSIPAADVAALQLALLQPAEPRADEPATLKLGDINARLAPLRIDAAGLAELGIVHCATDKAAKLYRESDFGRVLDAIGMHITSIRRQAVAAA